MDHIENNPSLHKIGIQKGQKIQCNIKSYEKMDVYKLEVKNTNKFNEGIKIKATTSAQTIIETIS